MFETLFDTMNAAVIGFLAASYADFGNTLRPIVVAFAVIYVMFQAMGYLRGTQQQGGAVEIAGRALRICLVVYFATDWATFDKFVYSGVIHPVYDGLGSMIVKATNTLAASGAGADYSTLGKWMDGKFKDELTHAFSLIGSLISWGPLDLGPFSIPIPVPQFSPGKVVGGICQVVGVTIFFAIAFYSVLMSQLGLLLVLLFSPLFIVCYMFDMTRSFAESWLRTVVGMVLIPAFLQVAIVFCFWLSDKFAATSQSTSMFIGYDLLTGDTGIYTAILLALAWIGMGMFLLQIPGFVTGMVGSLSGSQPNAIVQYISDRAISAATHGGSDAAKSASSIAGQGAPSRPAGGGVPGAVQASPSGPPGGGAAH